MSRVASLPDRLEAHLNENPGLLPSGCNVLVALSGGPDSMALLDLLGCLRERLGIRLGAAHFDHGVRPESGNEARMVARWATELGVSCRIGSPPAPIPDRPTQAGLRDLRYAFLHEEAERTASRRLATAHHADDQAETVLFRLMRGTGLRGLAGIPDRRGQVVRPLLPFRRAELEEYVRARHLPFLTDPSNEDTRWARVRVRRVALPALERSWSTDPASRLGALAHAAARADTALDDVAWHLFLGARHDRTPRAGDHGVGGGESWTFDAGRLATEDDELLARGLRRLARRAGVRLRAGGTVAGVQFIKRGRSGAEIDLGGGLRMWREFEAVSVGVPPAPFDDEPLTVLSRTSGKGSLLLGSRRYEAEWSMRTGRDNGRAAVAVPDELLRFPLELRARRPGDRIRLAAGSRSLKRLFNDLRVPRGYRGRIPVLASGDTVFWAYGLAVADGVAEGIEDRMTEKALRVEISPAAPYLSGGPRLAPMTGIGDQTSAGVPRA